MYPLIGKILSISLVSIWFSNAAWGIGFSCRNHLSGENMQKEAPFTDLPVDLMSFYKEEVASLSNSQISKLNRKTQETLENYKPVKTGKKARGISLEEAYDLLNFMQKELLGEKMDRYDQPNCKIGFCFGRAYYAHLMLLKKGIQPDSIRKLWSVGDMQAKNETVRWQFHVATAVFVTGYGWMALDTNISKPFPIRHWFSMNIRESTDGRVRIYVTDPKKFSVSIGKYDKVQLGFKLERENDWYQHYFVDHTNQIRNTPVERVQD